ISITALTIFGLIYPLLISLWLGPEKLSQMDGFLSWFTVFELFFIFTITKYSFLNANGDEKLALRIVLMFTSFNVIGMLIAYLLFKTSASIPAGIAISIFPAMYFLHVLMGKKLQIPNVWLNSFTLLLPSTFASCAILSDDRMWCISWITATIISLYFVFL